MVKDQKVSQAIWLWSLQHDFTLCFGLSHTQPLGQRVVRIPCLWKLPRPGCSAFWGMSSFFWVWLSPIPPGHFSLPCRQDLGPTRTCFSNNSPQALSPAFGCRNLCPKIYVWQSRQPGSPEGPWAPQCMSRMLWRPVQII